jgi:hypothetical protein
MTTVAIFFLCLIALPIVLFIGIHIYAYCFIFADGFRLRNLLQKQNRVLSLKEAKRRTKQKQGMIIIDAPTLGWNVNRVWWSPVNDFETRPVLEDKEKLCSDQEMVNYKKFIEPTTGIASLIEGFVFTQRTRKYLERHFGSDECLFIRTGAALTQDKNEQITSHQTQGHGAGDLSDSKLND